jgi:uncharacterized protein YegL
MKCYFNLVSGSERIADQEGVEVRDLDQAWAQAMRAIEELREDEEEVADWANWSLEVTDGSGTVLFTISLGRSFH